MRDDILLHKTTKDDSMHFKQFKTNNQKINIDKINY